MLDNDQKSYTVGGLWERQVGQGVVRLVVSRSWTDYRFRDVDGADVEVLRNRSTEVRMPLRLEGEARLGPATEIEWGLSAERVGLDLDLFQEATPGSPFDTPVTTETALRSWRTGAYVQAVRRLADSPRGPGSIRTRRSTTAPRCRRASAHRSPWGPM